jgi:hypothetical protein
MARRPLAFTGMTAVMSAERIRMDAPVAETLTAAAPKREKETL